jgi:hypothetical protein
MIVRIKNKTGLFILSVCTILLVLNSCAVMGPQMKGVSVNSHELELCKQLNIDEKDLAKMKRKPLFKFTEQELDKYLGYLQEFEPDLRKRIQHLAKKTVGQPYNIFLLGEYPFEIYDPDPLYSLKESDCVVFSEHMYAMTLAHDWPSFFALLQRIRYKDGEIGMLTRNHYTEADWDINNSWLIEDITVELAGDKVAHQTSVIDRARFFRKYGIGQDIPKQTLEWTYIPYQILPEVIDKLQPGDFVNIVRGNEGGRYVGHVGLITRSENGTVNFLHSTSPKVKEQQLMDYYNGADTRNNQRRQENETIAQKNAVIQKHNANVKESGKGKIKSTTALKPYFYGFKFFRLRENPLAELKKIDGPNAPKISINTKLK